MNKIYQGSNDPIVLEREAEGDFDNITAVLVIDGVTYKHWSKGEIILQELYIILPLSESDTMYLPIGTATIDIKAYKDEVVQLMELVEYTVERRYNKDKFND